MGFASRLSRAVDRVPSYRSSKDARLLGERLAATAPLGRLSRRQEATLAPAWLDYTEWVSSPDMTMSLELAGLLAALRVVMRPERIVDLGSGFSSYVLRRSRPRSSVVYSVDDSDEWLTATERFLGSKEVATEGLITWDRFLAERLGGFDLILYDLGSMRTREDQLGRAADALRDGGVMVLDDCHKTGYRRAVRALVDDRPSLTLFDLKNLTRDGYGRYAWVVASDTSGALTATA